MKKLAYLRLLCRGIAIFVSMKTPSVLILIFLFAFLSSCEKVELPDITNGSGTTSAANGGGAAQWGDSVRHTSLYVWGHYCMFDLATGEMVDSTGIEGVMGEGLEANPYTVYGFLCGDVYERMSSGEETVNGVWVTGYIVGFVQGRKIDNSVFGCGNVATNIIIGESPFETMFDRCVPVQLPTSPKYIRSSLNLRDNPSMLGARISIQGDASIYMSAIGLKNPKKCYVMN